MYSHSCLLFVHGCLSEDTVNFALVAFFVLVPWAPFLCWNLSSRFYGAGPLVATGDSRVSSLHTGSFWTFVASLCAAVQRGAGSCCWSLAINCVRGGCGGWAGRSSGWRVSGWPSSLRCFSALPSTTPGLFLPGDSCAAPVHGDWPSAACSSCSWKPHCRVGRGGSLFPGSQLPPQERWVWRGVAVLVLNPDSSLLEL